jgi:hypothetical protein
MENQNFSRTKAQHAPPAARHACALPFQVALVTAQDQKGGTAKYSTAKQASVISVLSGPAKQAFRKA